MGKSSMSSDGKKGSDVEITIEPVEMEGSNVLGVVAFSAPPSPVGDNVTEAPTLSLSSVHEKKSLDGKYSPPPRSD
jgi:hypothetical protein